MDRLLRVLIVDDSAFVRKVVKQMLSRSPFLDVVGTAHDGNEALTLVEELKPDVVTLDLIMPGLDGLGFLREQMQRRPLPVIVCSIASESGELALQALEAGAVDFVQKPTALATEKVYEMSDELIAKVKAAALTPIRQLRALPRPASVPAQVQLGRPHSGRVDIVVLGISTGGPQALKYLIPQLPADFPVPFAVVLHMPVGYTEMYARSLNEMTTLAVKEARDNEPVQPGTVLIAPAGHHLSFRREGAKVLTHLDTRPFDSPHRPSVDVLFRSAADVFGERVLGVVMTGMGADGKDGGAWIKAKGGLLFTEAEETCVVYGMPRSVVEAGLSDRSVPLQDMAKAIVEVV